MKRPKAAGKTGRPSSPPSRPSAADATLERVRELARIATEFDLAEVEADPSGRVRVSRRGEVPRAAALPSAQPLGAPLSLIPSPPAETDDRAVVASPFVGTFYRSPSPEAPSFVDVGQSVRKGQVVCIVEAMKLMNEIESEFDGKVLAVLVKNGEHVEYGQTLFRLERS